MYTDTISRLKDQLKDSKVCKQMKINGLQFTLGGVLGAGLRRALISHESLMTKLLHWDK